MKRLIALLAMLLLPFAACGESWQKDVVVYSGILNGIDVQATVQNDKIILLGNVVTVQGIYSQRDENCYIMRVDGKIDGLYYQAGSFWELASESMWLEQVDESVFEGSEGSRFIRITLNKETESVEIISGIQQIIDIIPFSYDGMQSYIVSLEPGGGSGIICQGNSVIHSYPLSFTWKYEEVKEERIYVTGGMWFELTDALGTRWSFEPIFEGWVDEDTLTISASSFPQVQKGEYRKVGNGVYTNDERIVLMKDSWMYWLDVTKDDIQSHTDVQCLTDMHKIEIYVNEQIAFEIRESADCLHITIDGETGEFVRSR